ncbi:hypothetical protein ACVIWU_000456 [Bradyrhizobium sp. USDA 4509]
MASDLIGYTRHARPKRFERRDLGLRVIHQLNERFAA